MGDRIALLLLIFEHKKTLTSFLMRVSLLKPGSDLLSHGSCHTIIGAKSFHFRVRDGIGWFQFAMAARQFFWDDRVLCDYPNLGCLS